MKILQISPYYPPAWGYGGPPRVMHALAKGLVERGHEVTVFTTDACDERRYEGPSVSALDGISVRRFPNFSNALAWHAKKYLPRGLLRALAAEVADHDAVHATDSRTYLTAAAGLATRLRGVPLCLSAHGSLPGSRGIRGLVKKAYDLVLLEPFLRSARLLLAQTEHEAAAYVEAGGRAEAVRLLPLPLDLRDVRVERDGQLRKRFGIDGAVPLVLTLGRIHYLKGLDILISALAPALVEHRLALLVVGRDDGQQAVLERRFRALIGNGSLVFAGPMYGDDRWLAYAQADVFALTPRHWEETSLAALEAAACGTPLVVSEQAGVPGLEGSGGGRVVPLEPQAIRSAVDVALTHREAMGAAARALVEKQHSAEVVVERLEAYLLDALA